MQPFPAASPQERSLTLDDTVNKLARELADAIAGAVGADPQVEACRSRARDAGFELQVSLEATIGFAERGGGEKAPARVRTPRTVTDLSPTDRRFLRSLRISPDEAKEEV